jgi:zinc-binding alcohol dehydrogenase/oxidoreductase
VNRATLTKGEVKKGDNVLVTGIGGGVALFALQFAVAAGANVYVTSSKEEKIQRAIALGAKGGVNYKKGMDHRQKEYIKCLLDLY